MQRYVQHFFHGLILMAVCSVSIHVVGADEAINDGNFLLRACKGFLNPSRNTSPQEEMAELADGTYCAGFIDGMADLNSLYQSRFLGPDTGFFCLPKKGIETGQTIRIVIKYLEDHPEDLHYSKDSLVILALDKAFPCKNTNEPKPTAP